MLNDFFRTLRISLRENWLLLIILVGLVLLPYLIGWATDSSPFGVPRGDRMIMRGESVRWQAVLIELFVLAILAMSYNLMFGFTGVVPSVTRSFLGLVATSWAWRWNSPSLTWGWACWAGLLIGVLICGVLGLLMGLVSLRLRGVYFAIFTLAVAEISSSRSGA